MLLHYIHLLVSHTAVENLFIELIEWLGIWIAMHPVVCYDTIDTTWLLAGAAILTTKCYKIFPV
jgi:hypothetical protein